MAILSDNMRKALWAKFMSDESSARGVIATNKSDLRAAVNAIDQWVDDNQASFNTAIPQPARGVLTAAQKAALLMYVVTKRFEEEV